MINMLVVTKRYAEIAAVDDVSFDVNDACICSMKTDHAVHGGTSYNLSPPPPSSINITVDVGPQWCEPPIRAGP
jgi:hypothetical protein